ncbi:hypothetical protein ACWGJX_42855 [Streptomyces sp. NPDC054775]
MSTTRGQVPHHHWAIATARAVPTDYQVRYVQLGTSDIYRRLSRLAAGEDIDFFCVIDLDTPPSARPSAQAALHTFLERKYPFPSRFGATPNEQVAIGPRLTAERTTS